MGWPCSHVPRELHRRRARRRQSARGRPRARTQMRLFLIILASVASLVALVAILGALLPRDHVATLTARIAAPPGAVWSAITDTARFTDWRADVTKVDILPATATGPSWREYSRHGAITMVVDLAEPPHKLVGR